MQIDAAGEKRNQRQRGEAFAAGVEGDQIGKQSADAFGSLVGHVPSHSTAMENGLAGCSARMTLASARAAGEPL